MLRRGLALGAGLVVVILIVLGIKGCLDARAHRALSDYARNVSQILDETEQTSKTFFSTLEDPGGLSVREFVTEVEGQRSAMDNLVSRVEGLSAPGDMGNAQSSLELTYTLRGAAMTQIANKMSTALGDAGADRAVAAITKQMQNLAASDVVYEQVVRPEINGVLSSNGIQGSNVPRSTFVPDGLKWQEEDTVSSALGAISGSSEGSASGVHGLGLAAVTINGSELAEGTSATVGVEETAEVEVQVENQGESTENDVAVSISVSGANTLEGTIEEIPAGEIGSVSIPIVPTPKGEVTLEVEVEVVAGEQVSENNEASYTVVFE
jgi:hypothetical protein